MLQPGHGIFSDNDECRCKESACQSLKTARIHWHRNGAQHFRYLQIVNITSYAVFFECTS